MSARESLLEKARLELGTVSHHLRSGATGKALGRIVVVLHDVLDALTAASDPHGTDDVTRTTTALLEHSPRSVDDVVSPRLLPARVDAPTAPVSTLFDGARTDRSKLAALERAYPKSSSEPKPPTVEPRLDPATLFVVLTARGAYCGSYYTRAQAEHMATSDKTWCVVEYKSGHALVEAQVEIERLTTEVERLHGSVRGASESWERERLARVEADSRIENLVAVAHQAEASMAAERIAHNATKARVERLHFLRAEVLLFAEAMERKLRANDHKGHWSTRDVEWLLERLREETNELAALHLTACQLRRAERLDDSLHVASDAPKVLGEAADVANFALFIADVCGALTAASMPSVDTSGRP